MDTCWGKLVMTLLCGIFLFVSKTEAIKFSAEGVSVPDGVLRVDEATELGCKYIMWRQETLASVTWSIQYSGVKTDFFVYKPFNKEVKPGMSMLSVDAINSEDKMVNLRLTDGQEDEVVICCDVKVLRDDGYGSITTKQKEKCSAPIRVEDQSRSRHSLISISADVPESGTVGETVPVVCNARNLDTYHTLKLMVNGRTLREIREHTLQYSLPLHQTHFSSSSTRYGQEEAVVSCLVKDQRGSTIANATRIIRKEEPERLAPIQSWDQEEKGCYQFIYGSCDGNGNNFISKEDCLRTCLPNETEEPCSQPSGVAGPCRGWFPTWTFSPRFGNSRDGRDFPSTSQSGVPRRSYLILEETYSGGSRLLGRVVDSVIEQIPNPSRTADNVLETSLAPIELLDVLGFSGHRVVGVSSKNNRMVWTLESEHSHREL